MFLLDLVLLFTQIFIHILLNCSNFAQHLLFETHKQISYILVKRVQGFQQLFRSKAGLSHRKIVYRSRYGKGATSLSLGEYRDLRLFQSILSDQERKQWWWSLLLSRIFHQSNKDKKVLATKIKWNTKDFWFHGKTTFFLWIDGASVSILGVTS